MAPCYELMKYNLFTAEMLEGGIIKNLLARGVLVRLIPDLLQM